MTRRRLVVVVLAALVLAGGVVAARGMTGGAAAKTPPLRGNAVWAPGARPAPPIRLRDQDGHAVRLSQLLGRPVLLAFLDSHCRTLCPVLGHELGGLQQSLGATRRANLVAVSVNIADTPASVRAAARRWGWPPGWTWLMGTAARLSAVWREYGVSVRPTATDMTHTSVVYLIDTRGDERAGFLPPLNVAQLAVDVRLLDRETASGS